VSFEKVMDVVFDAPNVAVPVGTAGGAQLAFVFQSCDIGLRSQIASCEWATTAVRHRQIGLSSVMLHCIRHTRDAVIIIVAQYLALSRIDRQPIVLRHATDPDLPDKSLLMIGVFIGELGTS
jgi:hypothetical protein